MVPSGHSLIRSGLSSSCIYIYIYYIYITLYHSVTFLVSYILYTNRSVASHGGPGARSRSLRGCSFRRSQSRPQELLLSKTRSYVRSVLAPSSNALVVHDTADTAADTHEASHRHGKNIASMQHHNQPPNILKFQVSQINLNTHEPYQAIGTHDKSKIC